MRSRPHVASGRLQTVANSHRSSPPGVAIRRLSGTLVLALALAACGDVPAAFGTDAGSARTNADQFFRSLEYRFTSVERTPKFAAARARLARYALSPSGIIGDTGVWTSPLSQPVRTLTLSGALAAGSGGRLHYVFDARRAVALPTALGASRHEIRLRSDGDDAYTWWTDVDQAMGPMHAEAGGRVLSAFLSGGEGHSAAQIRAGYAAAFPNTTRHLSTLFRLDSVGVQPYVDGSHAVTIRARLLAGRLGPAGYPHFEQYVKKYVEPARFRFAVRDPRGTLFFDAEARDEVLTVRVRTLRGALVSLTGTPRPLPDDLRLHTDAATRFGIFTVGVRNLVAEMSVSRGPHLRAWDFRWRKEPDWEFPLAVNQLIRTPLRHPFAGEGIAMRLALEENTGAQTTLSRRMRVPVKESAIVRWLGGLGNTAMSDFAGKAEADENRWLAELFEGLRLDSSALLVAQCRAEARAGCED